MLSSKNKLYIIFIPLLALLTLLQGCFPAAIPEAPVRPVVSEEPPEETFAPDDTYENETSTGQRGRFTLRYDPEGSLNPITGMNSNNILLCSLLYESLFTLDGNLGLEPQLCANWTHEGYAIYEIEILPGIAMNDGSTLTADDVAYTLSQAAIRGRYVNRLKNIDKITTDGDLVVSIKLKTANRRFLYLLDIPIIKYGSIDAAIPPGTGPYVLTGSEVVRLQRAISYRDYDDLPLTVIYLRECGDDEEAELFEDGAISLLWDDPSGTYDKRLNRTRESRYYDTTALQFIGFNTRSVALKEPDVRRAIGCAIDREYITTVIMPGQSLKSSLALSPAYEYYDPQWAAPAQDIQVEMSALLDRAGLQDFDNDSYLEYPDGLGGFFKFTLDFIVNNENAYKVRAAHLIAESMRQTGLDVKVRELTWDNFTNALNSGNFDMYYGETAVSADFDLSALVLPEGNLNYGKTGNPDFKQYIADFLAAETPDDECLAAKRLCDKILWDAPFVPILYKRYAVYSPLGAISGAAPSQSGVFRNINEWSIDASMLR